MAELSYCRFIMAQNESVNSSWRIPAAITLTGILLSVGVAWTRNAHLSTVLLGSLVSFLIGLVWSSRASRLSKTTSVLETPFHLAHDAEVFDRYRQIAHELLRISSRADPIYRKCALESLDTLVAQIALVGDGKIIFEDTEAWRLVYEQLLREPRVTVYRSVALVRSEGYWQDGAGTQSMQLNFELISKSIVSVERTVILADDLWPIDSDLPIEPLRQWIHKQSVHGIWIRLVRETSIEKETDLQRDIGIYGFVAVGFQELDVEGLRTSRFTLDFDFTSVREAEARWNRLNVYAVPYKDLLDQFSLNE